MNAEYYVILFVRTYWRRAYTNSVLIFIYFMFYVTLLHETLMILESRCFHFWQSTNFYIILTANFDDETVNKISVLKFEHEEAGNTL